MVKKGIAVGIGAVLVLASVVGVSAFTFFAQPGEKVFNLAAREFSYNGLGYEDFQGGPTLRVNVGDTVRINLINEGGVEHEIMVIAEEELHEVLEANQLLGNANSEEHEAAEHSDHMEEATHGEGMHHPEPVFDGAMIHDLEPGQTGTMVFVADEPGTYVYACLYEEPSLHAEHGMYETIIVES